MAWLDFRNAHARFRSETQPFDLLGIDRFEFNTQVLIPVVMQIFVDMFECQS